MTSFNSHTCLTPGEQIKCRLQFLSVNRRYRAARFMAAACVTRRLPVGYCQCVCDTLHQLSQMPSWQCAWTTQQYTSLFVSMQYNYIYRLSQEECARFRESVPYVKLYRYNPKHLYPKLNGYGDNGHRSLKLWQLLLTYWLPNTYWNWQEYVVSVMLISVLNIKVTCKWRKAIKLNYKNTRTTVVFVLRFPSNLRRPQLWTDMNKTSLCICWRVITINAFIFCLLLGFERKENAIWSNSDLDEQ